MKKIGLSLVAVAFCVACVMAGTSRPAADDNVRGWVIDTKCSANPKMLGNVECAKKCEADGAKLVIVADKDKHIYTVDNQDALQGHEGHHVSIDGKLDGDNLHVDKVTMLSQAKPM